MKQKTPEIGCGIATVVRARSNIRSAQRQGNGQNGRCHARDGAKYSGAPALWLVLLGSLPYLLEAQASCSAVRQPSRLGIVGFIATQACCNADKSKPTCSKRTLIGVMVIRTQWHRYSSQQTSHFRPQISRICLKSLALRQQRTQVRHRARTQRPRQCFAREGHSAVCFGQQTH